MSTRKRPVTTYLLFPFSMIYLAATGIRNLMFDWGILLSKEYNLPVISVGNITVGGTGKTPHVEYLVELLRSDYKLACLSRGYRRKTRQFIIADDQSTTRMIGDEPTQYKHKFPDMTVAVDRRRTNGIEQLLKLSPPIDVILLDDAFQHRYVNPGKSILLMEYNRLITDDLLLPAGRLRESVRAKKRADIILVTKSPRRLKPLEMRSIAKKVGLDLRQHLFFTTIEYQEIQPVFDDLAGKEMAFFREQKAPVVLLTGIANPRPMRTFARRISTRIHEIRFPDHHHYSEKDLHTIEAKAKETGHADALVLTTEKDAMKLREMEVPETLKQNLYYVPIRVVFMDEGQEKEFNQIILNYVRSNQRNNILHQGTDHHSA